MAESDAPSTIAIIGVGYVGEHLMEVFSSAFPIVAYDISASRIDNLRLKYSEKHNVKFSTDSRDFQTASHFLLCVPTSLSLTGGVDSSHIRSAVDMLYPYVKANSIVVVESTVAVGMTRQLLGPLVKARGIFGGMSPEVRHPTHSRNEMD